MDPKSGAGTFRALKRILIAVVAGLALVPPSAQAREPSFVQLLDRSNRYAMQEWYPHRATGGSTEQELRPAADQAFALAVGVATGRHSQATRRRRAHAVETVLGELARSHPRWGNQWQSALWASHIGLAALVLRGELTRETRSAVRRVVASEANRFVGYAVPYYRRHGLLLTPGDTKGEENAWNARVLSVALALLPRHPNRDRWALKKRELVVSALARPQDAEGRYAGLLRGGSNVNSDYTVTNHGHPEHPDYAAAILGLTGNESFLNHRQIYRRLTQSYEPDGTIRRDWHDPLVEGRPPFVFALVDAQARVWGYGGESAARWERLHLLRTLHPQTEWAAPYGRAWNQGLLGSTAAMGVLLSAARRAGGGA